MPNTKREDVDISVCPFLYVILLYMYTSIKASITSIKAKQDLLSFQLFALQKDFLNLTYLKVYYYINLFNI